jgi:hypothetical protein
MNENRVKDLEYSLRVLLDEADPPGMSGKLQCLSEHMAEYIGRWLGFARLENLSVASTLKNRVFFMVIAGIIVIQEYIEQTDCEGRSLLKEWNEFKKAVEWVRRNPEKSELSIVENTFETFQKKLTQVIWFSNREW